MKIPKKHWNMLTFDELACESTSNQFYRYSLAYLDSAERLCKVLKRSSRKATYERGSVVLYLAIHATELFLKAAIVHKAPKEKFGHDLMLLYNRYNKLYTKKIHGFDLPFRSESAPPLDIKIDRNQPDQVYRYPRKTVDDPWSGHYSFEANSFLITLQELRTHFERMHAELTKQVLQ